MNISLLLLPLERPNFGGILALVAAGVLLYVYIGYPLLLAAVSAFFRRERLQPGYTPRLSLLICAYNEETSIERKVRESLDLEYPPGDLEVLVVSDASTDRTDEIVQGISDPRVRLLRIERRGGKTNAQNEAVKQCSGEVIVFSDATAIYNPKALLFLANHYADKRVGAVSGRYEYFDRGNASPTGLGSRAFWNYENTIKILQSRIKTLTGCSGCIYSVRRSYYVPLAPDACSDLVEPLCLVRAGYRVVFEDRALAFEETTKDSRQEFTMRVRVATRGMRGVLSVPELLRPWRNPWTCFQLVSHKVLRWLVPVMLLFMLLGSAANLHVGIFALAFALQTVFYALVLLSLVWPLHLRWKVLGLPLFFCTLNAAALVSILHVLRGQKFTTWNTVR